MSRPAKTNPTIRVPSRQVAQARAQVCGTSRLPQFHPARVAAKQELKYIGATERLTQLLENWPPLREDQVQSLQGILASAETLDPNGADVKTRGRAAKRREQARRERQARQEGAA